MAQYRINELAVLTNNTESTIRQHIKRGKLIKNENGYIDENNPINMVYFCSVANGKGINPKHVKNEKGESVLINANFYSFDKKTNTYTPL
jgi:hypothetical protein